MGRETHQHQFEDHHNGNELEDFSPAGYAASNLVIRLSPTGLTQSGGAGRSPCVPFSGIAQAGISFGSTSNCPPARVDEGHGTSFGTPSNKKYELPPSTTLQITPNNPLQSKYRLCCMWLRRRIQPIPPGGYHGWCSHSPASDKRQQHKKAHRATIFPTPKIVFCNRCAHAASGKSEHACHAILRCFLHKTRMSHWQYAKSTTMNGGMPQKSIFWSKTTRTTC